MLDLNAVLVRSSGFLMLNHRFSFRRGYANETTFDTSDIAPTPIPLESEKAAHSWDTYIAAAIDADRKQP